MGHSKTTRVVTHFFNAYFIEGYLYLGLPSLMQNTVDIYAYSLNVELLLCIGFQVFNVLW